ncbi:hypothetical protein [Streptomyces lavendulocolor]
MAPGARSPRLRPAAAERQALIEQWDERHDVDAAPRWLPEAENRP